MRIFFGNIWTVFLLIFYLLFFMAGNGITSDGNEPVPVIYCTDLFHPHDDVDDHFDIATLFAVHELEIKAVILDQGEKQEKQPGGIPLNQLIHLQNSPVPFEIGLSQPLKNLNDRAISEPKKYQNGVRLILETLRQSDRPVWIITVGSLRDVAAAFNREPDLFRQKVHRLLIFAGDANNIFVEHNQGLDPFAYARMMTSKLPLDWVPCFDGGVWKNKGNASFFRADHARLLENMPEKLLNFFIYALMKKSESDPVKFLYRKASDAEKDSVIKGLRNLWCAPIFTYPANRKIVIRQGRYMALQVDDMLPNEKAVKLFDFTPVSIGIDYHGRLSVKEGQGYTTTRRFRILDHTVYARAMTSVTNHLLRGFF